MKQGPSRAPLRDRTHTPVLPRIWTIKAMHPATARLLYTRVLYFTLGRQLRVASLFLMTLGTDEIS